MKMYSALERDILVMLTRPGEKTTHGWEVLHRFIYKLCVCNCRNIPLELSVENPFAPKQLRNGARRDQSTSSDMVSSLRQETDRNPNKTFGPQPHLLYYMFREKILIDSIINEWAWSKIRCTMQENIGSRGSSSLLLETYVDLWSRFSLGVEIIDPMFHSLVWIMHACIHAIFLRCKTHY